MILLDPTYLRDNVDYSFGDQSSDVHKLWNGYMKNANIHNQEFIEKYNQIKKTKKVMTLFIDNIRLYKRDNIQYTKIEQTNIDSKIYKNNRVKELSNNDLLSLCSTLNDINFIIFTGFEDTPIDDEIFDKIPENVIAIYASNSISFGGKVKPIPYGIQRMLHPNDNRQKIIANMLDVDIIPDKLLYINHNVGSNPDRMKINDKFKNYDWVTIEKPNSINDNDYKNYLSTIKKHKFMICPSGNAIGCECHRDWEVLYMNRVPIVERSEYLEEIFKNLPVLFVEKFEHITEKLLLDNEKLFNDALNLDKSKLDFEKLFNNYLIEHN